jgi:hypothetical protein
MELGGGVVRRGVEGEKNGGSGKGALRAKHRKILQIAYLLQAIIT